MNVFMEKLDTIMWLPHLSRAMGIEEIVGDRKGRYIGNREMQITDALPNRQPSIGKNSEMIIHLKGNGYIFK